MCSSKLPAEAIQINGEFIEDQIRGYRTLEVTGRELTSRDLQTVPREGNHGSLDISNRFPAREITINYILRAKDDEEFRLSYNRLNQILGLDVKEVRFKDEIDYTLYGRFTDMEEVTGGTNIIKSSFTLYCSDPFKYSEPIKLSGKSVKYALETPYRQLPDTIEITLSANTGKITINNGDKSIVLEKTTFMSGNKILIDFKELEITENGTPIMETLTLASNFSDFYLGDNPIELVEKGNMEVSIREVLI